MKSVLKQLPLLVVLLLAGAGFFFDGEGDPVYADYPADLGYNHVAYYRGGGPLEMSLVGRSVISGASRGGRVFSGYVRKIEPSMIRKGYIRWRQRTLEHPKYLHYLLWKTENLPDSLELNGRKLRRNRLQRCEYRELKLEWEKLPDTLYWVGAVSDKNHSQGNWCFQITPDGGFRGLVPRRSEKRFFLYKDDLSPEGGRLFLSPGIKTVNYPPALAGNRVVLLPMFAKRGKQFRDEAGNVLLHVFLPLGGTKAVGRDVLGLVLRGFSTAAVIMLLTLLVTLPLGAVLGLYAGFTDNFLTRIIMVSMDMFTLIPRIIVVIFFARVFRDNLLIILFILALVSWAETARLLMHRTRILRRQEFMLAGITSGASSVNLLLKHLLPNLKSLLIIQFLETSLLSILMESTLTFLKIIAPPVPSSWGYLLRDANNLISTVFFRQGSFNIWQIVAPILAIMFTIGAFTWSVRQIRRESV